MMTQEQDKVPRHVAIVMDGNGRWAKQRGKKRTFGHKVGVETVKKTVESCVELGIQHLTLFAFSSENWQRPQEEVGVLMGLFVTALEREVSKLNKNGVRIRFIGDKSRFSEKLQKSIASAEQLTESNNRLNLTVAANYGGRWDILQGALKLAEDIHRNKLDATSVDESTFENYLSLKDLPDVDLFIRTGGEHRISNFLLWQLAYSELYFSDVFWPDFDHAHFCAAIAAFQNRERRFGKTSEQLDGDDE